MNLHVAKDSSKVNQEMKGRETTASRATWLSWNCTGGQGDQKFHLTWMFLDDVFILMAMIASVGTRWNKAVSDTCMPVVGRLNIFNLDTISIPKHWWDPQWLIPKLKDVRTIRNCRNTVESIQYTAEEASFPLAFLISVAFPLAFLSLSECTFLNLAISLNRNSEMTMLLAFASTWREGVDSVVVPPRHWLICLLGYFVLCS